MSGYSYQELWLGNALDHLVDRRDCLFGLILWLLGNKKCT